MWFVLLHLSFGLLSEERGPAPGEEEIKPGLRNAPDGQTVGERRGLLFWLFV